MKNAEKKHENQKALSLAITELASSKTDDASLMEAKRRIEDAAQAGEESRLFIGPKKELLMIAARALGRIDQLISARNDLLNGHNNNNAKFKLAQLAQLLPAHKKGKGKPPQSGCVEVVECLAAISGVSHFDENGFTHKCPIRDRWDALCFDFSEWVRSGEIDLGIRQLNPLCIPSEIAIGCGHRLAEIDPVQVSVYNVACGNLLPWIGAYLEIQSEHNKDVLLLKSLEDCGKVEENGKEVNEGEEIVRVEKSQKQANEDLRKWRVGEPNDEPMPKEETKEKTDATLAMDARVEEGKSTEEREAPAAEVVDDTVDLQEKK